jgi:hypothetical protein
MYPSGFEPVQEVDHVQPDPIEERRVGSSWKIWAIVMLVIAAFALLFVVFGQPESATDTTLTPPTLEG